MWLALFVYPAENDLSPAGAAKWSAGQRFGYQRRYSVEIPPSVCLPDVLPTWSTPQGMTV